MTYLQFKDAVKAETIPDKDSTRLNRRHDGWIVSALIEIQQKIRCLQSEHKEYISQDATYYSCGASAFEIPKGGYVKSLKVQETLNPCNYIDAIPMTEAVFKGILQNMQNCRCGPPVGVPDDYSYYYGYEYDYGEYDSELTPATPVIDLKTRPRNRAFTLYDGNVWVWPVISSNDTAVLRWHGVKKNWRNTDIMPWLGEGGTDDPEVQEVVQWYFQAKRYQFDICDQEKSNAAYALYRKKVGEMMVECVRRATLPSYTHVLPAC